MATNTMLRLLMNPVFCCVYICLIGLPSSAFFSSSWVSPAKSSAVTEQNSRFLRQYSVPTSVTTEQQNTPAQAQSLTQKEYLIAVRNRLYAVEEQIWLHEYATARPGASKIEPFSEAKYDALLRARGELLEEYPVTKLYTDLMDAQQRNLTYAAMYLERLISNFNRQLPLSMDHINSIAVLSHSGQVANLMRGQGAVYHRLLPSTVLADRGIKRQFQHPAFSNQGRYLAMAEMHFRDTTVRI